MNCHLAGVDQNSLPDLEQCSLSFSCHVEVILVIAHSLKLYYLSRLTVTTSEVRDSCIQAVRAMCPQTSASSVCKLKWCFCITRTPKQPYRAGVIELILDSSSQCTSCLPLVLDVMHHPWYLGWQSWPRDTFVPSRISVTHYRFVPSADGMKFILL